MNSLETRKFEMLARVREFGASHAAEFTPGTRTAALLADVAAAVDALSARHAAQLDADGVARAGSSDRSAARARIRARLEAIGRTAAVLAAGDESVRERFRLPSTGRDQALVNAARVFLANAEPLMGQFAEHELNGDAFAALAADVATFESALTRQRRGHDARVEATAAIRSTISDATRAVRTLDTIMKNRLPAGSAAFSAWKAASRIQHSPRVPPTDDEAAGAATKTA